MWWHWISWQHWAGLFPVPKLGSVKFISFPAHYLCPSRCCFSKAVGRQIHPSGLRLSRDLWMHLSQWTHQCSCPEKGQTVPKPTTKSGWRNTARCLTNSERKGRQHRNAPLRDVRAKETDPSAEELPTATPFMLGRWHLRHCHLPPSAYPQPKAPSPPYAGSILPWRGVPRVVRLSCTAPGGAASRQGPLCHCITVCISDP